VSLADWFTVGYVACFQACGWPAVIRIWRRGSSADLSIWREALVISGCLCQLVVMWETNADWRIFMGPFGTLFSVIILTVTVLKFRET